MKKAFITGITGQDGSYLTELLLDKGYEVHGMIRRTSNVNTFRIAHLFQDPHVNGRVFFLHYGDLSDAGNIRNLIFKIQPDEVYNLGAQSHVRVSFDMPEYTADIVALGPLRILEAIKDFENDNRKKIKYYQASTSEMFGAALPPQNEQTLFHPRSPYGFSKVFAFHATINYREAYGIFAVNGILFNHESPRRGEAFVTKKITEGIVKILRGEEKFIYLGNLEAKRDWGYAPEYMEAAYLMMQQPESDDYVIGTGESHSVEDFVKEAFRYVGIDNWKEYVKFDNRFYRPTEINNLIADASKARRKFNWEPKTRFTDLVKIMMEAELKRH